jgi:hypothetical protein
MERPDRDVAVPQNRRSAPFPGAICRRAKAIGRLISTFAARSESRSGKTADPIADGFALWLAITPF